MLFVVVVDRRREMSEGVKAGAMRERAQKERGGAKARDPSQTHLGRRLRLLALQRAHHGRKERRGRLAQALGGQHLAHGREHGHHLHALRGARVPVARLELGNQPAVLL